MELRCATDKAWLDTVMSSFDLFLVDHAACERKASTSAMHFVVRYPDRKWLLDPMIELAKEELAHFHKVYRIIEERGLRLGPDTKDPYVGALLANPRGNPDARLLDRLLIFGITEARGCERFGMIADALPLGSLKVFYEGITASEARHHQVFLDLALQAFSEAAVFERLDTLLELEGKVVSKLENRPALH